MQTAAVPKGPQFPSPEYRARPVSRTIAVALAAMALAFGVAGLWFLSTNEFGLGLIGFGLLLAVLALLAQSAEHFARASEARR